MPGKLKSIHGVKGEWIEHGHRKHLEHLHIESSFAANTILVSYLPFPLSFASPGNLNICDGWSVLRFKITQALVAPSYES